MTGGTVASPRAAHLAHAATAVVLHARHLAPGEAIARMDPRPAPRSRRPGAGSPPARGGPRRGSPATRRGGRPGIAAPRPSPSRGLGSLRGAAAERRGPATPPVWLHWLERLDEALRVLSAIAGPGGAAAGPPRDEAAPAARPSPAPRGG
jgi:hypothetical protein